MSQSPLPPTAPDASVVDVENVQGDIIFGLPKKKEEFVFFVITDVAKFKAALKHLKVSTTGDVIRALKAIKEVKGEEPEKLITLPLLNISFSQTGLTALGIKDSIGDPAFAAGQLADAQLLGDEGQVDDEGKFDPSWETAFKGQIHGVLLFTGESWKTANGIAKETLKAFGKSIRVVYTLKGSVRPGAEKGHEHFGWEDGISNPAVKGIVTQLPGQRVIRPGVVLLGKEGDPVASRPSWAVEGSFLAFRQLEQLVPEFHKFLTDNPIDLPGLPREKGSELLGARLVGRWKSGAPIQLAPLEDDPVLAKDPQRNNDFVYPQDTGDAGQVACPYAAHIRKTNPRNDLDFVPVDPTKPGPVEGLSIPRSGIPYGPEVTFEENEESLTEHERGLAFVSYQSALNDGTADKGFRFIQRSWANSPTFPPRKSVTPGFDPIVGQKNGEPRETLGSAAGSQLTMPRDFVVSRGGEYFFSPSIKALKTTFST
ncbi:Dyp-type peroxidase [Ceratobasidium sp. AG-I]|nr:Dyp-type peroxidase [Ceratobasidium sp. AG-I]